MGTSTPPGPIVTQVAVGEGVGVSVEVGVCVGVSGLVGEGVVMVLVGWGTSLAEGMGDDFCESVTSARAQLDSITARNSHPKLCLDAKWSLRFDKIVRDLYISCKPTRIHDI
jgi:hypothetical protein